VRDLPSAGLTTALGSSGMIRSGSRKNHSTSSHTKTMAVDGMRKYGLYQTANTLLAAKMAPRMVLKPINSAKP
jgi:hypothetical protein